MNKVYVNLFSALNLGDDLFLKILLERYPNVNFVLVANDNYNKVFKDYKNLTVINDGLNKYKYNVYLNKTKALITRKIWPSRYIKQLRKNIRKQNSKAFSNTNIFLSIGGSIFMQPKKLPAYADIEFYKLVNEYFSLTYYLGCNFGPYNDDKYKNEYRNIFSQATDVCFRDQYSYNLFSELGNIRYKPDIVFGLHIPYSVKRDQTVGFTIISPRNGINKSEYIKKYADLIQFYQNSEYEISLFSFCKKQNDEKTIEEIIKLLPSQKNIKRVFYNGNIESFLDSYGSVQLMYCGRFHSMILSMLFNQYIYPVVYSQKMINVLNDINYQGSVINIEDFHKIKSEEVSKQIYYNEYNIDKEKKLSHQHFEILDRTLII